MDLASFRRLPLSFIVLLILFASLPFSYIPVLQLGTIGSVHIDVAWIYGVSALTILTALPALWRAKTTLFSLTSWRFLACWLLFITLSLLWTANLTRGLITAVFAWMLFLLVSVVIAHWPLIRAWRRLVLGVITVSVGISCLFALWQLAGDALGVSASFTLLPQSYRAGTFDFARPTAFSLEPQFFASILLAPWIYTLHAILRKWHWWFAAAFAVLTITLGVTLSRGAFIAMIVAGLIILCTTGSRLQRIKVASFSLAAVLVALLALLTTASLGGNNSVYATLDSTLNQVSLGLIDLPSSTDTTFAEDSSSSRIEMAGLAVDIWSSQPTSLLIGTGIGGFGAAAHTISDGTYPTHLVANNYYAEMLAELGLIGVALFAAFIGSIAWSLWRAKQWLLFAILVAYMTQWSFFSGNANVIHIWVLFGAVCALLLHKKSISKSSPHLLQ